MLPSQASGALPVVLGQAMSTTCHLASAPFSSLMKGLGIALLPRITRPQSVGVTRNGATK